MPVNAKKMRKMVCFFKIGYPNLNPESKVERKELPGYGTVSLLDVDNSASETRFDLF